MPADKIRVERRRLETVVHVREWPIRDFGFNVWSSAEDFADGSGREDEWKPNDVAAIRKRLAASSIPGRLSGAEKGRVLWAVGYYVGPGWVPVGALLYTVPARKSKPLLVFRICLYQPLPAREKDAVTVLLLRCIRRVATQSDRGGGRVQWLVDPKDSGEACQLHGFRSIGRNRDMAVLEAVAPKDV